MDRSNGSHGTVLVVDDDESTCALVKRWLEKAGYEVEVAHDGEACLGILGRLLPEAICLDLNMPGMGGLQTLERIKATHRLLPVIILTSTTEVNTVVETMQLGAYDYLVKPIDRTELITTMRNAVAHARMSMRLVQLEREVDGQGYAGIVGNSSPMRELFRQMDRVATSDISVLIHGSSGTGKELVARAIHQASGRKSGPFVALNCAAIPETLQESELFGHERGSFTGATGTHIGKFEQAHHGTLFLDEVGELSLSLQAKLLRVLQERRFHRVGGTKEIEADFRLLAATNRNLWDEVQANAFREDLYFRIVVFDLEIPSLKDRAEDIPLLAQKFLTDFQQDMDSPRVRFSSESMAVMMAYDWPGNVRELQNAVQRALVVSSGNTIVPQDLPPNVLRSGSQAIDVHRATDVRHAMAFATPVNTEAIANQAEREVSDSPVHGVASIPVGSLKELERLAIEAAMARHHGNVSKVVRELKIGRTTLYRKLKEYKIET